MFKLFLASLLAFSAFSAFAAEEAPKKPSFAEEAYQKAIEANSKDVFKTYDVYLKALEDANKKIVKALEAVKADLNNVKKGSMSLTERADAIKEVDEKIAELKKGSLGDVVSSRKSGDLLGDGSEVDIKKMIVGKWMHGDAFTYEFKADGTFNILESVNNGKWTLNKNGCITLTWMTKPGVEVVNNTNGAYTFAGKSFTKIK